MGDIYNKKINLGKIAYSGKAKRNAVEIDVRLYSNDKHQLCLAIQGSIWNATHTDHLCGGQNYDEISNFFKHNKHVQRIIEIWKRWHLNDMRPGCEHQEEYWSKEDRITNRECLICGYKYGSEWRYEKLPVEIVYEICSW